MRSSSSWKHSAENNRGISGHFSSLHKRLYHALNLGLRCPSEREWKWQCTDIEIQRLVIRSIDAFLDCISSETSQHPLVKDSVAHMVGALECILQFKNESILSLASNVAVKMVKVLPNSILKSNVLDLVRPLSCLLSSGQLQVAVSCATALSLILLTFSIKKERDLWEILRETNTIVNSGRNIQDFPIGDKPVEYLQAMISLLSKILWLWPASRFSVWNDAKLMEVLHTISLEPEFSVKVVILKLYSTIALCGNGANKLLENGEALVQMMVHCMNNTNFPCLQLEGFKLAQCFTISERGCFKKMKICCEPLIKSIISGLSNWSLQSVKGQMPILVEACRLSMITRWAGEHHNYFWKLGIDSVLLDLVLNKFHSAPCNIISLKEQIIIAKDGLNSNLLLDLRPYIWDILGCLATHCAEDFDPKKRGNELYINLLITCACLSFMDSIRSTRQIYRNTNTSGNESASRAVLLMIYSPCKYIASQARLVLSEILKPNGKEDLKYLLNSLDATSSGDKFRVPYNLHIVINLMSLVCYLGLPQYRKRVIESRGIKTFLAFIRWWLSSPVRVKRLTVAPHLRNPFNETTCCYDYLDDWEGEDMILLFSLWGFGELIHHSGCVKNHADSQMDYTEGELVSLLEEICSDSYAPGPRWFAAYILSYFGLYGIPSKLGKRIGKALNEKEYTDLKLVLTNQEFLSVHGVIVVVRCPSLLPCMPLKETSDGSSLRQDVETRERLTTEVRLSAHVDHEVLSKVLEYVYSGYIQAGEDLVKKLKILARHCNLHLLLQMLYKKSPKWNTPVPSIDLTFALGPAGHHFWDIILEAKTNELVQSTCNICSLADPHMHAHKVILCSSCDYLRALFQSGMQESQSQTIKVPISWEALFKLVNWFYSDELLKPISGCLWDNLEAEEKLNELKPYLELCSLAEFWLLEDLQRDCTRVIISCLDSARYLSIQVIQIAANYSLSEVTKVAANYMAPLYHCLRNSGELEELDDQLIDMVRTASVRLSQGGDHRPS